MVKIALDAGHGLDTPGKRTPDGEREWSFNDKVLRAAWERLSQYGGVQLKRLDDPTGNTDVSLGARTSAANAWGADVLVSIHHNANTGRWGAHGGVESLVQTTASKASRDIAEAIHPRVVRAMGLRDRGIKSANLHMTRESRMPAILIEGGFMDSTTDIVALRDNVRLKAQGFAIAEGLAEYFKLRPKSTVTVASEEVDNMSERLPKTQQDDMRALLRRAYDEGIFSVDHTAKVDTMTRGQAVDLLISYVARKK